MDLEAARENPDYSEFASRVVSDGVLANMNSQASQMVHASPIQGSDYNRLVRQMLDHAHEQACT